MKKVTLAKSAGFCFGVKRAVNKVYEEVEKQEAPIYTYGPIIHNEEVVKDLEAKGVTVLEELECLEQIPKGTVVIRSHGVGKKVYERIKNSGFTVEDATCPFVLKIHRIVEEHSKAGEHIVIIGNNEHPEVEGIKGWCATDRLTVIQSVEDAEEFSVTDKQKICIVSQTTFNYKKFQELVEIFCEKGYDVSVVDTICNATEARQTEARCLAAEVDAMIVIGGANSSNTRKLYEICSRECKNTFFIQSRDDLNFGIPDAAETVGITAGASTPNNIIEEVQNYVRLNF